MRRWIWIVGTLVIIGLACWAWPLIGAAQLAQAAQTGNTADVVDRVDTDRLRRSLARQIATAYLDASGRGKKMGSFGRSIAGAAVTTVADPYVAELLTPENLTALLAHGRVNRVTARPANRRGQRRDPDLCGAAERQLAVPGDELLLRPDHRFRHPCRPSDMESTTSTASTCIATA